MQQNKVPILLIVLVTLFTFSYAVQNWRFDEDQKAGPKEHNSKNVLQYPKRFPQRKLTPKEEEAYLNDIIQRASDENSDVSEILSDIESLVNMSPSTPSNMNFSFKLRQIEKDIRENVTRVIDQYQKNKQLATVDNELIRYKRANSTCFTIVATLCQTAGAASGSALLGSLFSIIPVIGTAIGIWLGGTLGSKYGLQLGITIANKTCPNA